MKTLTKLLLLAACLPGAVPRLARAADTDPVATVEINAQRDPEWIGYRRAYKAAAFFAPFVRTRPLIQAHLQVRPLRPDLPLDGLRLSVAGARTRFEVAVDAMGRAVLPMEKQAYEDDAVITLNRQKGSYYFSGRYSIRERDDGLDDASLLREACEQLLAAQRASGYRMRLLGKQCAGVTIVYPAGSTPEVALEAGADAPRALAAQAAHPFEDGSMGMYQVVTVRFADLPAGARVNAVTRPLAIGTVYE
ncbi:hypothetical protein F2P45_16365 [Massilia sp. CCM 8733]|uniref:Uncharacterized protein n=1 Tax=Massilia mucilaginosa TaxID=2609282 RepID=A0ABX0NUG0_9BURK|nr:hypothetical protein [Massilia mucilaginosa]NHZ90579.1 hypothetical protein [Massilia mucilaginosa]